MTKELTTGLIIHTGELSTATAKERYDYILKVPEVTEALKGTTKLVAISSNNLTVEEVSEEDLVKRIAIDLTFLGIDLGITELANKERKKYIAARFLQVLKRHYSDLTLQDVKLAFELLTTGKLDEYLPKNSKGNPDRNHYSKFNVQFYTKVLGAFRLYKLRVWAKITDKYNNVLAIQEHTISEAQKEENRASIYTEIYGSFDSFLQEGIAPNFVLKIMFAPFFDQGLITMPNPTRTEKKRANKLRLSEKGTPADVRAAIRSAIEENQLHELAETHAQRIANNRALLTFYKQLKSRKKHLKEVLVCQ